VREAQVLVAHTDCTHSQKGLEEDEDMAWCVHLCKCTLGMALCMKRYDVEEVQGLL